MSEEENFLDFDDCLQLERQSFNEGFTQGVEKGTNEGFKEGYEFGMKAGKQLGTELGHIYGFVSALIEVINKREGKKNFGQEVVNAKSNSNSSISTETTSSSKSINPKVNIDDINSKVDVDDINSKVNVDDIKQKDEKYNSKHIFSLSVNTDNHGGDGGINGSSIHQSDGNGMDSWIHKERVLKTCLQIQNHIKQLPWKDLAHEDGNIMEKVELIRSKFKLLHLRIGKKTIQKQHKETKDQENNENQLNELQSISQW